MDKNYLNELVKEFSVLPDIEERTRNHNWAKKIAKEYSDINFRDPEAFNQVVTRELDEKTKTLFFQAWFTKMPSDVFFCLRFVYLHYPFFLNTVSELINSLEETENSKDKAKWLINKRIEQIHTGEITNNEDTGYDSKQIQLWLDLIASLSDLYYGFPEKYMRSRAHLLLAYNA